MVSLQFLEEIPRFINEEEEAKFWDMHSIAKLANQLELANATVATGLKKKLAARNKVKKLISLGTQDGKIEHQRK